MCDLGANPLGSTASAKFLCSDSALTFESCACVCHQMSASSYTTHNDTDFALRCLGDIGLSALRRRRSMRLLITLALTAARTLTYSRVLCLVYGLRPTHRKTDTGAGRRSSARRRPAAPSTACWRRSTRRRRCSCTPRSGPT